MSDVAVAAKKGYFFSASRDRPICPSIKWLGGGRKVQYGHSPDFDRSIRRWDCKTLESDLQLAHAQGHSIQNCNHFLCKMLCFLALFDAFAWA